MDAIDRSDDYPAVFRERAEELRSIALLVHDPRNREILLKCAADYDDLALQHEEAETQGGVFKFPPPGEAKRQSPR